MPWPQDAYVGQKVVCVDGSPNMLLDNPKEGLIYTISKIGMCLGYLLVDVEEIKGNSSIFPNFKISRFRPIQSTSTSYSLLANLQDPSTHKVRQDQFDKELIDG